MSATETIVKCIAASLGQRVARCIILLLALLAAVPHASALTAQTITGFAPATPVTYSTGKTFTLSATGGGSGKPVVFASTTTGVCTVAGNKASVLGAGTCVLTANQAGSATYSAAPQVTANVVINKGSQTITFGALAGKSFGTAPFTIAATASSGLAVVFTSTTTTVCTVAGSTVTLMRAGTCTIAANQAGNTNYNAATQVTQSFAVSKGSQTIAFGTLPGKNFGVPPFAIAATASSGLAVAFTSTTTTVCTVAGSTVTLVRAGTCTIAANQAGNTNYNAATQVTQSFAVTALAAQAITGFAPATPITFSPGLTFALSATGGASGNPVTFASTTSAVCTVAGTTASVIAAGTCTLKADQAGNASYSAAPQVSATVAINKGNQAITFGALAPMSLGTAPFTVAATASSGLAVTFTSATTTICTVAGATVTLVKVGTCTIRANQAGNTNFNAATQVAQSFTVQPAVLGAAITSPLNNATFTAPATIPIMVNAAAPSGQSVARLDYWRNGFWIGSDAPGVLYTFTGLAVGTHTFVVIANDTAGNSASSAPVVVTVAPAPQAVLTALTAPANGATYLAPATIALAATASAIAPGSGISRVDFHRGPTLLGTSITAPFAYTWSGAPVGRHALTAVATDNLGATGTSAVAYATVDGGDTCDSTPPLAADDAATKMAVLDKLPITFEENTGQVDGAVRFMARTPGFQFFLTDSERVMVLQAPPAALPRRARAGEPLAGAGTPTAAVRLRFVGANAHPAITGSEPAEQRSHYLLGDDPARWHADVRHFAQARYHEIYPGIDEVYSGRQGQLEYDLHVAPGADPQAIRLALSGVERLVLDASGDLLLETAVGTLVQKKPVAYQDIAGERRAVAARYQIVAANEVTFTLGAYDAAYPLVIDPVLLYSTLLGGTYSGTAANGIALSRCGEAYIVGSTYAQDFPATTTAFDPVGIPTYTVTKMGFVAKLNVAGTGLLYSTYLTGTWSNVPTEVNAVAVDATGHAFVAGNTYAADFPTTAGSAVPTMPASIAGFVAKLNNAGSGLVYSSYLPGAQIEGIAIDSAGAAYVAGGSSVWKVNATGATLDYNVGVGGTAPGSVQAIAVDAAGNAYVAGITAATDLPVTPGAFQSSKPSASAAGFVSKINPAGTGFAYNTYLGATTSTDIFGLALDAAGNAYVAGRVATGGTVPNLAGNFITFNQNVDVPSNVYAFAAKLNAAGSQLAYFSRVGGSSCTNNSCFGAETWANAIAVDQKGNAWITGPTGSNQIPLVTPFVAQFNTPGNGPDIFAAQLTPNGNSLVFSTLLGGRTAMAGANYADPSPRGAAIAVDAIGSVYIAGTTNRGDFPTTPGALQTTLAPGSGFGAFVVKINDSKDTGTTLTAAPNPGLVGSPVVLTATIVGNAPTGTVTFFEGAAVLGTAMIATTTAPFTATVNLQFTGGSHSLRAVYAGDVHHYGSTSAVIALNLTYPPNPNAYPTVTLTGIADGATLVANAGTIYTGASMVVNASAAAGNLLNQVAIVQDGGFAYWTLATPSFGSSYTLTTLTSGMHTVYASATDNFSHTTLSAPIRFVVNPATATAPTIAITAPANGASVAAPGPIAFAATAIPAGSNTVSSVSYFQGTTWIGGATTAPYSFNWANVPAGTYSIMAVATDSAGASKLSAPITVTVTPAPGVPGAPALTGATPGAGSATLAFAAPASDGGAAITGYTASCNATGQSPATASGAANATTITVPGMAGGVAYSCAVSASNSLGTGPASNSVNVTPTTTPSVAIAAPANNSIVGATSQVGIVVSVQVAPNTITRIEIFDGATLLTSTVPPSGTTTFTYTYSWRPNSLGSHALSAKATDSAGAIFTSGVVTVLAFFPPSATLAVAGNFFLAPADIDLYAAAAGTAAISKVELFSGTTLLATLTAEPYNYRWRDVATGSYTLTAKATDSLGLSSTSAPVTVTVGSAMAIIVDAGVDGSTVNDDTISFAGALRAPANSAVDIAGRLGVATLDGRFFFNNLPLQPGSNTLTITVTNIDGQTAAQTITVNSNGQAPFVLTVSPAKAFAPLAAGFTLTNRGNAAFKRIELRCNDDAVIGLTAATIAAFNGSTCTFNLPGTGRARVNVIGQVEGQPEQVIYTATQSLYSAPVVTMDKMLRGVYADMLSRLKAGNIALALNAVTAAVRANYSTVFGGIANLAAAVDQIGTIEQGTINDKVTEYLVVRRTVAGDTGHLIYLMPGEDGIWRIDGM